jgi:hypothetical protein
MTGVEQVANKNLYFDRPLDRWDDFGERGTQVEPFMGVPIKSKMANVLGKIRMFRELNNLFGKDPLSFLASEAEKNDRKRRKGELNRNLSPQAFFLTYISSGFGVLPKLYHIDVDRGKNLIVWRVQDAINDAKSIQRFAMRQPTTAAQRAQLRNVPNPILKEIPGYHTRPADVLDWSTVEAVFDAAEGK